MSEHNYIPYGRQNISKNDIKAIKNVLESKFLTQGPAVPMFEEITAQRVKAKYAVALNSATSALHLSCLALGLSPGDRVWTSPITFVATANCARYCQAEVDFVDVDINTGLISISAMIKKLEIAKQENKLPKIVIPVHLAGASCDMEQLGNLSKQYGFSIIEDASHAIGGFYLQNPIGSCRYSSITIFSFHPVKIITTGEGGMALTNDEQIAKTIRLLRSHGVTRDKEDLIDKNNGEWYYEQINLGFNYRMTDIQAALGISQLNMLEEFIAKRLTIAKRYEEFLFSNHIIKPLLKHNSAWHLYIIRLRNSKNRLLLFNELRSFGIGANVHYIPVYLQPYYQKLGFKVGHCPIAEDYYSCIISIPIFPGLKITQQDKIINLINKFMPQS
tara:strand:- start:27101 stop:28264 length:1164 start_codon:yes stop_codon:yes gene_type:complete